MNTMRQLLTSRRWILFVGTVVVWIEGGWNDHHCVSALSLSSSSLSPTSLSTWKLPSVPTTTTKSPTTPMCPLTKTLFQQKETAEYDDMMIVADYEKEELIEQRPQKRFFNAQTKWILFGLAGTAATTGIIMMAASTSSSTMIVLPNIFTFTPAAAAATATSTTKSIWSSWKGWSVLSVLASSSSSFSSPSQGLDIWSVLQRTVIKSFDKMHAMFGKTLRKMLLMELWYHVWKHPNSPLSFLEDYIQDGMLTIIDWEKAKTILPHWIRRGTKKLLKKGLQRSLEKKAFQFAENIYQQLLSFLWPTNSSSEQSQTSFQ